MRLHPRYPGESPIVSAYFDAAGARSRFQIRYGRLTDLARVHLKNYRDLKAEAAHRRAAILHLRGSHLRALQAFHFAQDKATDCRRMFRAAMADRRRLKEVARDG